MSSCRIRGRNVMDISPLRAVVAAHGQPAVVALARGTEIAVDAQGGYSPDTVVRIASLSKPIVATAALVLVADGVLDLDDPITDLLPELADRRVLNRPDGPLDDTVPADRAITLRDLLTLTWGFGIDPALRPDAPIVRAAAELELRIGPPLPPVPFGPDEWLARLATLPLLHQPGARWTYDTGSDVLGVLHARATGTPLPELLAERVFIPLGMTRTAFHAAGLPPLYERGPDGLVVVDPADGAWSRPPAFPRASGGLVSTAADLLAFTGVLARSGGDLLPPQLFAEMTTDQLTPAQKGSVILGERGWGFGLSVYGQSRIGWAGGTGTYWFTDLRRGTTALLLTQCMFGPDSDALVGAFERVASEVLT
ncbi:CubicO group peptidase, beta-lactamase class C family [Pseudonocardia thermophila]|uniref:CubicO group peptidase, beta-lactamase class C family n=2 Tax=Pseudonocardia thermophila TaxID=1848 RepID=A0A1M6TZC0_PSETH|nr:CubicO group peptidase, beta-lactamase class C family [Pseudonocardia thermophila]